MKQIDDDRRVILIDGFKNLNYTINDGNTEIFMVKQDANNVTHLFWVTSKDVEYKQLKDLRYTNKEIPKKEMKLIEEFFE